MAIQPTLLSLSSSGYQPDDEITVDEGCIHLKGEQGSEQSTQACSAIKNLLSLSNSGYQPSVGITVGEGRSIHRFHLNGDLGSEQLTQACSAITNLLNDNPNLFFVANPGNPGKLLEMVKNNRFLVINGDAVCLSSKDKAPEDIDLQCVDTFFSEALIDEPIRCVHGHYFEKKHIESWHAVKKACPSDHPETHQVNSFNIDPYLRSIHKQTIANYEYRVKKEQEAEANFAKIKADKILHDNQIRLIDAKVKPDRTLVACGGAIKIVFKALDITSTRFLVLAFGKQIPIVSLVVGVVLAGIRFYEAKKTGNRAEFIKGVGEIASGIASCFPGIGTGVSIGLDALMLVHDMYVVYGSKREVTIDCTLALQTLGLDPTSPTHLQPEIDKAFRTMSFNLHPDRMRQFGEYQQNECETVQKMLVECKSLLYTHYGYAS